MGFSYGGTCGQYVPFGTAMPYVGLVAGVGAGVLDEIDLLPTDALRELSREVEAVLAPESIDADPADLSGDPTDVDPTGPDGPDPGELAEMDYEEFAGK
jgi:hypothetical protein